MMKRYAIALYYAGVGNNIEKGLTILDKLSEAQHIKASTLLGILYYQGNIVFRNESLAIEYTLIGANRGYLIAIHNLANMYYKMGRYVDAEEMFVKAANLGNSKSQHQLAGIYYNGNGFKKNISKSVHYLTLAADNNERKASFLLGMIYLNNEYEKGKENLGFIYLLKSAKAGYVKAQYNVGVAYYNGTGIGESKESSFKVV